MKRLYCNGKRDYCPHFDGENPTKCSDFNCVYFDGSGCKITEKEFTNYDRILNMSIDEMAEFISKDGPFCGYADGGIDCVFGQNGGNCAEHAKKWLESEAE